MTKFVAASKTPPNNESRFDCCSATSRSCRTARRASSLPFDVVSGVVVTVRSTAVDTFTLRPSCSLTASTRAKLNCPSDKRYSEQTCTKRLAEHSSQTYRLVTRHLCLRFINAPKTDQQIAHDKLSDPPAEGELSKTLVSSARFIVTIVATFFKAHQSFRAFDMSLSPPNNIIRALSDSTFFVIISTRR